MKAKTKESIKKSYNFTSIRVKEKTKVDVKKILETLNKEEDCGKVTVDLLVGFFLEKMTKEDLKVLQMKTVNWKHDYAEFCISMKKRD